MSGTYEGLGIEEDIAITNAVEHHTEDAAMKPGYTKIDLTLDILKSCKANSTPENKRAVIMGITAGAALGKLGCI